MNRKFSGYILIYTQIKMCKITEKSQNIKNVIL